MRHLSETIKTGSAGSWIRILAPAVFLFFLVGCTSQESEPPEQSEPVTETTRQRATPDSLYNPPYPNNPVEPFRIIGNIYYVGRTNYTAFLITTPEGHFLLDTMGEDLVPEIGAEIEALGFDVKDVKYLLTAHAHTDHVGGHAAAKEMTGAQVLVMAQDAPVVEDGGRSDFRSDGSQQWTPVEVDRMLEDGDRIELGGVTMVAHLTAGHTKGCTAWSTVVEADGQEYHAVFMPSNRVSGGVALVGNEKYPEIADAYAAGFATLKKLPCDVFLASHGFMFNLEEKLARMKQGASPNPFIDPQGCQNYIQDYEDAFLYQLEIEQSGGPPA